MGNRQIRTLAEMTEEAEMKCRLENSSRPVFNGDAGHQPLSYCPRTFDGWSCWEDTLSGHVALAPCPEFIVGFDPNRTAHKVCTSDGSWFRHPDTNLTWSNYTSCVDLDDLRLRQTVNSTYVIGYSTSVVALSLSMVIFLMFKSLRCTRISIHKNLFLSFIINNGAWIVWYTLVIQDEQVLSENKLDCQILHVLLHYFLVCNYFWMFCEGLYLHTLLVVAFVNDEGIMKWFYLIGWATPAILTCVYAGVRSSFPEETLLCWSDYSSPYTWILSAPICASMLANLIFLINIVRVLVTKMRAVNSPDVNQTRKAVRATLILIPLLGLHYLVTPFRPEPKSTGEGVYEMVSAVVTSFQGLCVACLFCFFNGEVVSQIVKRWNQKRGFSSRSYSMAATTVSNSASLKTSSAPCGGRTEVMVHRETRPPSTTTTTTTTARGDNTLLQTVLPIWW